jgi:hypothetical protein
MTTNRQPRHKGRTVGIEKWTWRQAEEALMKNTTNRHVRQNDVDKYTRAMKSKLWGICTEPVVFDWDGNLIDGQHRFLAQVASKTTREWLVYRNVPPETQKHINTGIPRAPYDQLRFQGYTNSVVLASVARWAWLLEQGQATSGKIKVSSDEIVDMVDRHPDLQHSAAMGVYARTGFLEMTPSPVGAAHWWIAQHNDHAEADMFIDRFVHMNREPDGSAVLALMKRFSEARRQRVHVQTRVQIAMIIKTWNYDVRRNYVSKLNMYSRTGEIKIQKVLKREVSQTVETPLEDTPSSDIDDELEADAS